MTYGFEWYDSVLKRRVLSVDGDLQINEGAPLANETEIFRAEKDDENRIWLMARSLTGIDFGIWNEASYEQFSDIRVNSQKQG